MKKLTLFVILLTTLFIFGCNQAQQKPVPTKETLIPKESTIGFSQVDIDELPANIQKIASAMEGRPMVTWANDNNNSYILLNTGKDEENLKVNKIIQKVPVQDFLWLDIQLDYAGGNLARDLKNNSKLVAVKLEKTDKAINGVGFEFKEKTKENKEGTQEVKPQTIPTPAPTPAPITRESANQNKTRENIQLIPTKESNQKEETTQKQSQQNENIQSQNKESTPTAPNGD